MGIHRIGASAYGLQGQAGWTVRTNQTRLVGWSFTGVAYNPTTYHPEDAPDLIAVGSNWNGLVRLGLTLANDSRVSLGLGFSHTSNGALRRPNKGINTPHARLIVRPTAVPNRRVFADGAQMGAWSHVLGLGVGGRDHGPYGGHVFGVQELFAQSTFVWSPRVGLTAQLALAHHGALRADPNTGEPSTPWRRRWRTACSQVGAWGGRGCLAGRGWTCSRVGSWTTDAWVQNALQQSPNLDGRASKPDVFARSVLALACRLRVCRHCPSVGAL